MKHQKVIEVKGLYAAFPDRVVLSDVSCTAMRGEITVIIGSSGSGKTTLLRHLLGLFPVRRGYVSVLGRDMSSITETEQLDLYLHMGVFYQNGALLNSITVAENVALPLTQHTYLPSDLVDDIVRMKLGLVNLSDAYHLYPSELSGGMLKRAALARAIAMDPPLLFCDEPGAGLDPISLEALDSLILNLKEKLGMSVVMVTHEVSSILRVADRVIYLDQGVVVFEGNVKAALASEHPAVQNFFKTHMQNA